MANTEKVSLLKMIRDAQNEVSNTLDELNLTPRRRELLDGLLDQLIEIDNLILLCELKDSIDELKDCSKALKAVNRKIKRNIDQLGKVAQRVETVAKGIDAVVKAFGLLLAAGLCNTSN